MNRNPSRPYGPVHLGADPSDKEILDPLSVETLDDAVAVEQRVGQGEPPSAGLGPLSRQSLAERQHLLLRVEALAVGGGAARH